MLSYEALLFTVVFGLVAISHQYELAVKNIQNENEECPAVECDNTNKCAPKSSLLKTSEKCPAPETVCPSKEALNALGYELVPGFRYYKIFKGDAKNYEDAKRLCAKNGAHLVVVNSNDEAKALNKFLDEYGSHTRYWAGFDDIDEEGEYKTIYNKTTHDTGFARVFPGEFDGKTGQNCGIYQYDGTNYGLGDHPCNSGGVWQICERDDL
ncbi:hypothetical protein C0J52_20974 [Blattella germanica]|nr:hypothetical protein C0J52_20974 [Blattella germanica]